MYIVYRHEKDHDMLVQYSICFFISIIQYSQYLYLLHL